MLTIVSCSTGMSKILSMKIPKALVNRSSAKKAGAQLNEAANIAMLLRIYAPNFFFVIHR